MTGNQDPQFASTFATAELEGDDSDWGSGAKRSFRQSHRTPDEKSLKHRGGRRWLDDWGDIVAKFHGLPWLSFLGFNMMNHDESC